MLSKTLYGMVFLIVAIYVSWMVITSAKSVLKASASKDWPITMGVVVSTEAVKDCSKSYSLKILYRYTVGTTSYMGDRLAFGLVDCGSKSEVQVMANQYPIKLPVTVHFNPEEPRDAVILDKVTSGTWWLILTMPFGIVMFAFFSWSFLRSAWIIFSESRNLY